MRGLPFILLDTSSIIGSTSEQQDCGQTFFHSKARLYFSNCQ